MTQTTIRLRGIGHWLTAANAVATLGCMVFVFVPTVFWGPAATNILPGILLAVALIVWAEGPYLMFWWLHRRTRSTTTSITGVVVSGLSAVALIDVDGRVLLAQRPEGKSMAGLWEFPGGKVENGETPEAALIRELQEELGIDTWQSCLAPLTFASHAYDDFHLLMPLFACRKWEGTPIAREGQTLVWVRAHDLRSYPMPPADIPLIPIIRDWL